MKQTERGVHLSTVAWFEHTYPELTEYLFHFANERQCSPQRGLLLKRMGVKSGVADLFLAYPCGSYHGFWLELKKEGGKLSASQKTFLDKMAHVNYYTATAYNLDEAKAFINDYLDNSL